MIRQLITLFLALCVSFAALGNEKPSQKETQVRQENFVLTLGERLFDPLADEVVTQDKWNEISHGGTDLRLVQFDGPIQESWVESLVDSGLTPVQYIHPYTYITWADASSTDFALSLPHVRWTGDFLNGYRVLPIQKI